MAAARRGASGAGPLKVGPTSAAGRVLVPPRVDTAPVGALRERGLIPAGYELQKPRCLRRLALYLRRAAARIAGGLPLHLAGVTVGPGAWQRVRDWACSVARLLVREILAPRAIVVG